MRGRFRVRCGGDDASDGGNRVGSMAVLVVVRWWCGCGRFVRVVPGLVELLHRWRYGAPVWCCGGADGAVRCSLPGRCSGVGGAGGEGRVPGYRVAPAIPVPQVGSVSMVVIARGRCVLVAPEWCCHCRGPRRSSPRCAFR